MINSIIDDIKNMRETGDWIINKGKSFINKAPTIAAGLGIASATPYIGPAARGALKGAAKATGTLAKGLPRVVSTIAQKPWHLAAIPAVLTATNVVNRELGKTAGIANANMGWVTGKLPDKDKELLQRKTFRWTDIFIPHHQVRLTSKILRPSWFKDEAQTSERS